MMNIDIVLQNYSSVGSWGGRGNGFVQRKRSTGDKLGRRKEESKQTVGKTSEVPENGTMISSPSVGH